MENGKTGKQRLEEFLAIRRYDDGGLDNGFWSEVSLPMTLNEALHHYTKDELDTIRKNLNVRNVSRLRKAELITVLLKEITALPVQYVSHLESELFDLYIKMAKNGGYLPAPKLRFRQIRYFRERGIVYTGTFEGKKVLAIPQDLIGPILALDEDSTLKAVVQRHGEWVKLARGLLYYYGTIPQIELLKMVESYTEEMIDYHQFYMVILSANLYYHDLSYDSLFLSHIGVEDPKKVHQEHVARSEVSYYPFTKEQLLRAGEPFYEERDKNFEDLVKFLLENFEMSEERADEFVAFCFYATKNGESPNALMGFFGETLEFDSIEIVEALMEKLVRFMNGTREWFLKGHTSAELVKEEINHVQPLSARQPEEKRRKIGRNEPCPCGSGKKYKRCCGLT